MPRHLRPRSSQRGLRSRSPLAVVRPALLLVALGCISTPAPASELPEPDASVVRAISRGPAAGSGTFGTANSNCAGAECDTVWIGHSSAGPGGAYLGVGVGGVWDFDTDVAGTDSTQGWRSWVLPYRSGVSRPALSRPEWALDYGNVINAGDTQLWAARELAGREYVRTGVAGAWHSDTMAGVKLNVSNAGEPSAAPIAGTRSAWCGLREEGNFSAQDALTGNYLNGALAIETTGGSGLAEFPGFCGLWDQMMYKDFPSTGAGTVAFRFRTDMSTFIDTSQNGTGWFNPDPTSIANFVNNPADTFMVYVGSPKESAYDTNRRWFSEVLDLAKPYQEVFAISGKRPVAGADSAVLAAYGGLQPVAGKVRVVFRIKTNRVRSDQTTGTATGFNSKDGAALIDEVQVDGGTVYGFESAGSIVGRSLIPDIALDGGPWATTGKPPYTPFHVADVATLVYEDLCGAVGSPTRQCNLAGNVWTPQEATTGRIPIEGYWNIQSPTIDLAVRSAAPGTKNAQGIDQETASRTSGIIRFDFYSGFMDLDQSIFYHPGARAYAPAIFKQPISGTPVWTGAYYSFIHFNPDPLCYGDDYQTLSGLGVPAGSLDSLRVLFAVLTQGWRFGGTDLGNTRGTYVDNLRLGLVRGGAAPSLSQAIWNKYQDQFPFNESVPPGDNAGFDTTTALMRTGLNIVFPPSDPGVVPGDSIVVEAPFTAGDGVTTGVRVDLIFRIDPGPGNYSIKGNRASALVNRDPAHPFFATYLANNGPFGTPGGHGGTWNRHVWNSARMDSAELRLYPITSRAIGNPTQGTWMGTLHESDPNYATLGIDRPLCFLVDPNGSTDDSNISCTGTPPAIYGGVSGSSKEATKILPDGWFTPGTHIEYFVRKSTLEDPATHELLFDTTRVFPQSISASPDYDQERWSNVDVLPDMWKSSRFGGAGLACMLIVDGADRRGADPQYRGAADTLGYGKNNGATAGWRGLGAGTDPNDPAGFVAANLGQYGLNFDHYDIRASESREAGHPGVRFAQNLGAFALRGDTSGPSAAMLATLYTNVLHLAGDLSSGTLHDGFDSQEGADDIALYEGFLAGATPANRRGLWLSGDGIMEDGAVNSDDGTFLYPFLAEVMGSDLVSGNYKVYTGSNATTVGLMPMASWAHPGRIYGLNHVCTVLADVLLPVSTVDGAAGAASYQALGAGTEFTASVYRPVTVSREFRTLIDGFDLSNVRGHYASLAAIQTRLGSDIGRIAWFDDVFAAHFQSCARKGSVIAVGDLPGPQAERFANRNLGAFPNPAFAARAITLRFTLAAPQPVKVRIFNVAGREVAAVEHKGVEGENRVLWDGRLGNGTSAPAGVYFYRLDGVTFEDGTGAGAKAKLILLSGN